MLNKDIQKGGAFLRANYEGYEYIVKKIQKMKKQHWEVVLNQIGFAAQFATRFHPGKFADGAIENVALDIGKMLEAKDKDLEVSKKHNEKRQILHVASQVQEIGGHSRMIYRWMENDQSSCHTLVILNQEDIPIPSWLSDTVKKRGGKLFVFPKEKNLCQKAQLLRDLSRRCADLVVLHIDGHEVIPIVAFAVQNCPPVALVNHFDHHFWIGSTVIDLVIDLRKIGAKYTEDRRFVSSAVLPIPLIYPVRISHRETARDILKIPEDQIVLISIGRAEKYWPYGQYDFVSTAGKILDRQSAAHIYVIGESKEGIAPRLRSTIHDRLHFVGIMKDPSIYRDAADVYLESFPYGTQTSLLEASLEGLPVVPAYDPMFPLLVANDDALQDIISNPANEEEYIRLVETLIIDRDERIILGNKLQERLLADHIGKGWLNKLSELYQTTDNLVHNPRHIPNTSCKTTPEDIGLSLWHVIADNNTYSNIEKTNLALLWHVAFLSEYCRDYSKAAWLSLCAMFHDPRGSWRIFARMRNKLLSLILKNKR